MCISVTVVEWECCDRLDKGCEFMAGSRLIMKHAKLVTVCCWHVQFGHACRIELLVLNGNVAGSLPEVPGVALDDGPGVA